MAFMNSTTAGLNIECAQVSDFKRGRLLTRHNQHPGRGGGGQRDGVRRRRIPLRTRRCPERQGERATGLQPGRQVAPSRIRPRGGERRGDLHPRYSTLPRRAHVGPRSVAMHQSRFERTPSTTSCGRIGPGALNLTIPPPVLVSPDLARTARTRRPDQPRRKGSRT